MYERVELFCAPDRLCEEITKGKSNKFSEMTPFQRAFLCGLIKERRPEKVLEIGVSAGGTTALILTCLNMININAKMYSVDISECWYRSGIQETGFVAKEFLGELINNTKHSFLLGQSIPYRIEEIGNGIDFLILDTTHSMPGEFLDFLICLPYLKNGATVVLHDVVENHMTGWNNEIATKLLFDIVGGKWYQKEDSLELFGFSNIGAFEVTAEIKKRVNSLFSALTFSWEYMPEDDDIEQYKKIICKHYLKEYVMWFENIINLQKYNFLKKKINGHYGLSHEWLKMKWEKQKNVFLYGAGQWARIYSEYAKINHLPIRGWVISDEQKMVNENEYSIPVYRLGEILLDPNECVFVLALDRKNFGIVKKNLMKKGYYMVL